VNQLNLTTSLPACYRVVKSRQLHMATRAAIERNKLTLCAFDGMITVS